MFEVVPLTYRTIRSASIFIATDKDDEDDDDDDDPRLYRT